jgi:hypothetical protein
MADAPSRSLSALSIHSHGEGDLEDYVMTVVPTIPQVRGVTKHVFTEGHWALVFVANLVELRHN